MRLKWMAAVWSSALLCCAACGPKDLPPLNAGEDERAPQVEPSDAAGHVQRRDPGFDEQKCASLEARLIGVGAQVPEAVGLGREEHLELSDCLAGFGPPPLDRRGARLAIIAVVLLQGTEAMVVEQQYLRSTPALIWLSEAALLPSVGGQDVRPRVAGYCRTLTEAECSHGFDPDLALKAYQLDKNGEHFLAAEMYLAYVVLHHESVHVADALFSASMSFARGGDMERALSARDRLAGLFPDSERLEQLRTVLDQSPRDEFGEGVP